MSKGIRQLLILVSILVVIVAVYCGVLVYNSYQEKKAEKEAEAATIYVGDISTNLVKASFYNGTDTLSFYYDADSETWFWDGDADFPVEKTIINDIGDILLSLVATRQITISDDLSAYGLDPAVYTLTVEDADGHTLDLLIGNESPASSAAGTAGSTTDEDSTEALSYYYAMVSGGDCIYTISEDLVTDVSSDLYDLVDVDSIPYADSDDFLTLEFQYNGNILYLDKQTVEQEVEKTDYTSQDEDGNYATYTEMEEVDVWYAYIDGKRYEVSSLDVTPSPNEDGTVPEDTADDYLSALLNALDNFIFADCYDYKASDEVLSECGINSDSLTVEVTFQKSYESEPTTYTLVISDISFEKEVAGETEVFYYAKLADSIALNYVADDYVTSLFDALDAFFAD